MSWELNETFSSALNERQYLFFVLYLFLVAFCCRHDLALKNSFFNSLSQCINSTLFRMGGYNEKFLVLSLKKVRSSLKLKQTEHFKAHRGQQHAHESCSWHYLLLPQLKWLTDSRGRGEHGQMGRESLAKVHKRCWKPCLCRKRL